MLFYNVEMDEPHFGTRVRCGAACGWQGRYWQAKPIESCSLTPGDPSPAGRCPDCDALVYIQKYVSEG